MKRFTSIFLALIISLIFCQNGACSEKYFINNKRVILYKIINWWYYSPPEESSQLCGSLIKCQNRNNGRIEYNKESKVLKINIKGDFSGRLSLFRVNKKSSDLILLKPVFINNNYFNIEKNGVSNIKIDSTNSLIIKNVNKKQAEKIQRIENDLLFVLEGKIGGLLNGRIAIYQDESLLKSCTDYQLKKNNNYPVSFRIINSVTNKILIEYSSVEKLNRNN